MDNYPSPPKYMDKNYPPLRAIVMALFCFLKKMYHLFTVDIFYKDIDPIFIYPTYIHIWMFKLFPNILICYLGGGYDLYLTDV